MYGLQPLLYAPPPQKKKKLSMPPSLSPPPKKKGEEKSTTFLLKYRVYKSEIEKVSITVNNAYRWQC